MQNKRSLRQLLVIHELAFMMLVMLSGAAGVVGIQMWDKASHESQRISLLVQEIQQTRGDLYRQMKELFDAFFLKDAEAEEEYAQYTESIRRHFQNLNELAVGTEEITAVNELQASYLAFVAETSALFQTQHSISNEALSAALNQGLESGVFQRYETISAHTEHLLLLKQQELKQKLEDAKRRSIMVLSIPIILATLLFLFSRTFLKHAIMRPINRILHATNEISAGRLDHHVPNEGAAELVTLSNAINEMAKELARSQDALIKTEKQAALGLLAPMLAHNIRNPLASIRATAQVADSTELDTDTREALQGIMLAVDGLERWTSSLLAYLHPLKPQPNQTSLQNIIAGALVPLKPKLTERHIHLETPDWEKQEITMYTDQGLLEQTLYNLLLNAIEAIPTHSKIEILADINDESVRIMLADRGPGMPFRPDPHAISPGPTTKRFGTGLGIPFAFKVCESLNGSIAFMEREGGGTLIEIELPRFHHA